MGLEAVKEEIIRNAKEQSSSLIAEARKEAGRIMKEAENKIEEMKEKSDAQTKRLIDAIKRQELASAELENKKVLLDAKKQIIESVFMEAKKRLETLDDKKRGACIKKLIEKTKNDIEIAYAYCSEKDAKFLKGIDAKAIDIIGGLLAENKDETIRIDYSFETLLQSIKENELQAINRLLFA